ncbi:hypothetical protein DQ04_06401000 [Trypanosoma grayi]|uniref:hypothetical protein n=1 Tax=Trypanosoma grayi TaxID=71804 RepID=UPI0004F4800B|nr:hypothetical protein DQ04_06401000 [Trypanosoma grayi]KEG08812.1 hypothetical protein DQ04_06401000 [Trypanosoma grayi]
MQRAQLLVQRDAQVEKLRAGAIMRRSHETVRDVDVLLLNAELSRTLEMLQEQYKKRSAETEQVRESVQDFRRKIQEQDRLLTQVREYWRRNAAALMRMKNESSWRTTHALNSSSVAGNSSTWSGYTPNATWRAAVSSTARPHHIALQPSSPKQQQQQPGQQQESASGTAVEMWERYQPIHALGLVRPEEVAEFIYSVFEEIAVGTPVRLCVEE